MPGGARRMQLIYAGGCQKSKDSHLYRKTKKLQTMPITCLSCAMNPPLSVGEPLERFVQALTAEGIQPVSQGYIPLHHTPAIRKTMQERFGVDPAETRLPHTEATVGHTLWLMQNMFLGEQQDMDDIVTAVVKIQAAWR